jgi:AI-2 transport protein TqsA
VSKNNHINTRLLNVCIALITTMLVVYILIVGKSLLIPLLAAIVIWYLIIRLTSTFSRVPFTHIDIPYGIALLLALVAAALVIYGFISLVTHSIYGVIADAPKYQAKLNELMNIISKWTGSKFNFNELIKTVDLTKLFSNAALTLTYFTGNLTLIVIYVLFLLLEYHTFHEKIKAMCNTKTNFQKTDKILQKISVDINTYMKVKTTVSLLTALLSYAVLLSFGINYAQFWALLIFLLNFIPTIGSIVAVAFTLLAVSIQFNNFILFLLMALILITIQFIVGNIVEPKFMGKNLNLSPLVILLALAFWGSIWGILGMILCVPLMTILNIILANFTQTRYLAVLFSANPQVVENV